MMSEPIGFFHFVYAFIYRDPVTSGWLFITIAASVLIDFFIGKSNPPVKKLDDILEKDIPFGIPGVI